MECLQAIRTANGGWEGGGGYRTRGPVLHLMRCFKLQAWYQEHFACAATVCDNWIRRHCQRPCEWCAASCQPPAIDLAAK